jgi:hypothetical protein
MTPEEIEARTRLEQEAGRNAVRSHALRQKRRKRRYPPGFVANVSIVRAKRLAHRPIDPDVQLPADIQATIARGEAKFRERYGHNSQPRQKINAPSPSFIASAVRPEVQDRRDAALRFEEERSAEEGGQPPMLGRQRVVCIIVDRLIAEGVGFATARDSQMNKLVREWLNGRAARSCDRSKSRSKQVGPDAVKYVLKQIKGLVD